MGRCVRCRGRVLTIEDPVEYTLDGIHQVQVIREKGLDFARALRSLMRQDPDIILVGETRDKETAQTAMEAALTGHMVFTTLHANDTATAITRLNEMGIPPFLVGSSIVGVMAQRLIRRVCPKCSSTRAVDPEKDKFKEISKVWAFIDLASKCEMVDGYNIYFANILEYWFGGGTIIDDPEIRIFDLYDESPWRDTDLGITPSMNYAKEFCTFYKPYYIKE